MTSQSAFYQLDTHANHTAVMGAHGPFLTYAELQQQIDVLKNRLPNSRQLIFITAINSVNVLVAYLACLQAGHVALLLDEAVASNQIQKLVDVYKPNYLLMDTNDEAPSLNKLTTKQHIFHDDLALLLLTSGTAGSAKLVRLSYNNLQQNAVSICQYLPINSNDIAITALPFCYSYGLSIINCHLLKGAGLVLCQNGLVSKEFWSLFKSTGVTSFSGVPSSYALLKTFRFEQIKALNLKYLTVAGGRLKEDQWCYLCDLSTKKNIPVYAMYGQTEATARMAFLDPDKFSVHYGAIGQAIFGGQLTLRNEHGLEVSKENTVGELVYQGPNVMMGYAQLLPDLANGSQLSELNTGDLAIRKNGEIFIQGRLSRFIKISGIRINLDDVEALIGKDSLPVMVTGVDDRLIVAIKNDVSPAQCDQILSHLQQDLNINPVYIDLQNLAQLPLLSTGKPDYQSLLKDCDDVA